MPVIDEIKARIDIVDLVSESVKLRRAGKSYTGFCPFHTNTKTPAFAVFPDSGTWRCFGSCNEGGDIFKFVMKKEGWDFSEALRYLADRAGVKLEQLTPEKQAEDEQYDRLRVLLEEAARFYQDLLLHTPAGKPALDYIRKRGLTPETMQAFQLGYAPDSYEATLTHLRGLGYASTELSAVGLVNERDSGGVYDKFRNRITFPIRDGQGRMAGFGARILNPEDQPKFLNSPQTVLFDKSHLLYGLDQARKAIRAKDQVVIVEGYLDVILLHQAGYANTVSPMGTALNEDQLRFLKRYTRHIVLALDPDAAGEKATLRGLELARKALDHEDELVFDAHGLLRHEARLQADVRVTTLPEGKDPDEVVLQDPEEWQRILDNAKPIVVHVMETLASHANLDDAKVKADIVAQVQPLIEDVPSAVERDAYRQQLARLLKLDERTLLGSQRVYNSAPRRRRTRVDGLPSEKPAAKAEVKTENRTYNLEGHCLELLLRKTDDLYALDRALQMNGLDRFSPEDFENAEHQLIVKVLMEGLTQDAEEPLEYIRQHIPEDLQERYTVLVKPGTLEQEKNDEKILEDLIRTIMNLRLLRVKETLNQLRFMQQEEPETEEEKQTWQKMTLQYTLLRGKLDQAIGRPQLTS
ncbi:MAG: DNA primase [Anaerolineaceae bacterium]|nr:DNA primase [Anaerolineaceae bacterium]